MSESTEIGSLTGTLQPIRPRPPGWRRNLPLVLVAIFGFGLSFAAYRFSVAHERQKVIAAFRQTAQYQINTAQDKLQASVLVMQSLQALYASSESVERDEFSSFVRTAFPTYSEIRAVEWLPRIPAAQRAEYERQQANQRPGFRIWIRDDKDQAVPVGDRDEYFPILFIEPWESNSMVFGFDSSVEPRRHNAMRRAWESNRITVSERTLLLQRMRENKSTRVYGFLIFAPIYRNGASIETAEQRTEALEGMVLGVFEADTIVRDSLNTKSGEQSEVDLHIFDMSAPVTRQLVYSRTIANPDASAEVMDDRFSTYNDIEIGDRKWRIYATPLNEAHLLRTNYVPYFVLFGGIFLTLLSSAYVAMSLGRTGQIESLVVARTSDLNAANRKLQSEVVIRREAERARYVSEARVRAILDSTLNSIITIDDRGNIESINNATQKMYGFSREELLGKRATMLMPEPFRTHFDAIIDRYIATHTIDIIGKGLELLGLRQDGSTFPLHLTINKFEIGGADLFTCVVTDLSAQKAIEEQLELFFSMSKDLFCIVDFAGVFKRVSPAWSTLLGYDEGELLNSHLTDFVYQDDSEQEYLDTTHLLAKQATLGFENRYRTRDGGYRWLSWCSTPLPDRGLVLATARDVTAAKAVEAELKRLVEDLGKVNKELRDFAYIVSHDLKAPLRGIMTTTSWLRSDHAAQLDADGMQLLDLLTNRAMRMDRLIEGILQYSRIGRSDEAREAVELGELVDDTIDLLTPPAHIAVTPSGTFPTLFVNRTRFTQVFQNLIQNAIKYCDKAEGHIDVHSSFEKGLWLIAVSDNGPGIEARYAEKIFQMFQTLSSKDEKDSTGVGLAVVKKVVEHYGGRVWVESEMGSGSTFYIELSDRLTHRDSGSAVGQHAQFPVAEEPIK